MKYLAIIFDLDGTIIDSEPIWKKTTMMLLESKGITLTQSMKEKLKRKLHGIGILESGKMLKKFFNLTQSPQELITEQNIIVKKLYHQEIKLIDGFLDFYKKIDTLNLKKGIATNADYISVHSIKTKFGLDKFFGNHIYCVEDVNNISKPKPDIFLHTAKKLGVEPPKCIVIEDSMLGIQAAKKAGMFCIGINTNKQKELLKNADIIVQNYKEIDLENIFKA